METKINSKDIKEIKRSFFGLNLDLNSSEQLVISIGNICSLWVSKKDQTTTLGLSNGTQIIISNGGDSHFDKILELCNEHEYNRSVPDASVKIPYRE